MVQSQSLERFDVVPLMTADEARECEAEIIGTGNRLRMLLVEFYERQGYRVLGYSSYTAWAEVTAPKIFGITRQHLTRELTAAIVERELEPIGTNSGPIPETHLRPLGTFVDRPRGPGADAKPVEVNGDAIRGAWDRAQEIADEEGTGIRARHVEAAVEEMAPRVVRVQPTPENADLIGDGIDDVLDPPMEPAQAAELFAAPHHAHERRAHVMRVMGSSESPEWYTPRHIIDRVIKAFGEIDLDPCSNSREAPNVPALNHYTAADDGLAREWFGRVYMNPPYGDEIPQWVDRLVQAHEGEEIDAAIALLPARVDTNWFQPLWNYALCFVKGRLRFSGAENSAPFPSVIVYMGPDVELFRETFADIGRCGRLL